MNFNELNRTLEKSIESLNSASSANQAVIREYQKEVKSVQKVLSQNRAIVAESVGDSPEEVIEFFKGIEPDSKTQFAPLLTKLENIARKAKQAKDELVSMGDQQMKLDELAEVESEAKKVRFDYDKWRCNANAFENLPDADKAARGFRRIREDLGDDFDTEAFIKQSPTKRWVQGLVSTKKRSLSQMLAEYIEGLTSSEQDRHRVEALTEEHFGSIENPENFLKAFKRARCEALYLHEIWMARCEKVEAVKKTVRTFNRLEKEASPQTQMKEMLQAIKDDLGGSNARLETLAKMTMPDLVLGEGKARVPFEVGQLELLLEKEKAHQEIINRIEGYGKNVEKIRAPLTDASKRMERKARHAGHYSATGFDVEPIKKGVGQLVRSTNRSSAWFREKLSHFRSMTQGALSDDILMWTAVYMMFSQDHSDERLKDDSMDKALRQIQFEMADTSGIGKMDLETIESELEYSMEHLGSDMETAQGEDLGSLSDLEHIVTSMEKTADDMASLRENNYWSQSEMSRNDEVGFGGGESSFGDSGSVFGDLGTGF